VNLLQDSPIHRVLKPIFRRLSGSGVLPSDVAHRQLRAQPGAETAVKIFEGRWSSELPAPFAGLTGGLAPNFADARLAWALRTLGSVTGQSVLELGPLEGGQSVLELGPLEGGRQFRHFDHEGAERVSGGFRHRLYRQNYGRSLYGKAFWGGTESYSNWMPREEILGALRHFGFQKITIGPETGLGKFAPAFSLLASR
jgi:hypothetical protein